MRGRGINQAFTGSAAPPHVHLVQVRYDGWSVIYPSATRHQSSEGVQRRTNGPREQVIFFQTVMALRGRINMRAVESWVGLSPRREGEGLLLFFSFHSIFFFYKKVFEAQIQISLNQINLNLFLEN